MVQSELSIAPLKGVSVYMSTMTLTIIALDRYVTMVHPFRTRYLDRKKVLYSENVR